MRYYPCNELNLNKIKEKLSIMQFKEKTEQWLFTLRGIYKYYKDDLIIFKFNFNEKDEILRNYIRDSDFFVSPNTWKKIEVRHQLPFINQKMEVKSYIFSPSLKSKLHFIVEYYDSGKVDYYFTSPEESTNKSLQEDIGSFLLALT
jgi:hypothetical protein